MANWRGTEDDEKENARVLEDRRQTQRRRETLRLQQEETGELQRAFEAEDKADIVPAIPQDQFVLVETFFG